MGPRQIRVSYERVDIDSKPSDDETIYVELFFRETNKGRDLTGRVKSRIPFSSFPQGVTKEAPLRNLASINYLAVRNTAVVDYSPALLEGACARESGNKTYADGCEKD